MPQPTRSERLFAVPIVLLYGALYYSWFALHDRYLLFLYFHDMGPGFDTTPFGAVTASRYWMTGFVAGGAVLLLYLAANLLLGRLRRDFHPPRPLYLWALCAVPLSILIPAIVLSVNDPVLPLANAFQVTAAALVALALALALGPLVARHPLAALLQYGDGFALAIILFALTALQFYPRWTAGDRAATYLTIQLLSIAAALFLLLLMTVPHLLLGRLTRRAARPPIAPFHSTALLLAAFNIAYLILPLMHHLIFSTDKGTFLDAGYFRYIPDAANYFTTSNPLLQLPIWLAVALLARLITPLRRRLHS